MIKLTLDAHDFAAALRFVAISIERRNTIPIIGQFRLSVNPGETATLEATNLDQIVTRKLDIGGSNDLVAPLILILPPTPVLHFLSGAKGEVALTHDPEAKTCSLELDGMTMRLRTMLPPEDWPAQFHDTMKARIGAPTVIPTEKLINALRAARVCVSFEETRYYLNGAFFHSAEGELKVVATDGHRLAAYDIHIPWDFPGAIVPRDALVMIDKALGPKAGNQAVTMTLFARGTDMKDVGRIVIEGLDWSITTKTIDGTFPDYTRVVPAPCNDLGCVMTGTALARLYGTERTNAVKITPSAGTMELNNYDGDFTMTAPCTNTGDPSNLSSFIIALRLLRAFCTISPTIQLQGKGQNDPFRVVFSDPDLLCVVMPMRI